MSYHIKTPQEQIEQMIRWEESVNETEEKKLNSYQMLEFYLLAFMFFLFLYIETSISVILYSIAIIAIVIAIVDYCKQKYEDKRW